MVHLGKDNLLLTLELEESEFLRHLATMEELEPRASDRVLVWHTRTEKAKLGGEKVLLEQGKPPLDAGFEV